jgi:hypothetical protein
VTTETILLLLLVWNIVDSMWRLNKLSSLPSLLSMTPSKPGEGYKNTTSPFSTPGSIPRVRSPRPTPLIAQLTPYPTGSNSQHRRLLPLPPPVPLLPYPRHSLHSISLPRERNGLRLPPPKIRPRTPRYPLRLFSPPGFLRNRLRSFHRSSEPRSFGESDFAGVEYGGRRGSSSVVPYSSFACGSQW